MNCDYKCRVEKSSSKLLIIKIKISVNCVRERLKNFSIFSVEYITKHLPLKKEIKSKPPMAGGSRERGHTYTYG